jgi:hypothetical protein
MWRTECGTPKKYQSEFLILEASKMRKVLCLLLGFQLIVSGCSEHISVHCIDMSEEIASPPDTRENYHPALTPITDVAGECYCHVEDGAIVALTIVFVIGVVIAQGMAAGYTGNGRETIY